MKLSELTLRPPKILLLGEAGTGKTALVTSLGPGLGVVDIDEGLLTAATLDDSFKSKRKGIEVIPSYEDNPSVPTAWTRAESAIVRIARDCKSGKCDLKALCLDSYTTLADACLASVMSEHNKLGDAPQIQHWGETFRRLESLLATLRSLPLIVIVIGHICRIEDANGNIAVEINTPGKKLPQKIPTFFSEIWYMRSVGVGKKVQRKVYTQPTPSFPARTRSNVEDGLDAQLGMVEFLRRCGVDYEAFSYSGKKS